MSDDKKFSKGFVLYKAKGDGHGAASQWNLGSVRDCVFLEMSNQKGKDDNGNASFDWDSKIKFKLGEADIGEILAVLAGVKDGVGPFDEKQKKNKGLYHSNKHGNAIMYFAKDDYGQFRIYLSVKRCYTQDSERGRGEEKVVVQHSISKGEACVLGTLLRRAIEVMYRWN